MTSGLLIVCAFNENGSKQEDSMHSGLSDRPYATYHKSLRKKAMNVILLYGKDRGHMISWFSQKPPKKTKNKDLEIPYYWNQNKAYMLSCMSTIYMKPSRSNKKSTFPLRGTFEVFDQTRAQTLLVGVTGPEARSTEQQTATNKHQHIYHHHQQTTRTETTKIKNSDKINKKKSKEKGKGNHEKKTWE